jgi:hypothetical protein
MQKFHAVQDTELNSLSMAGVAIEGVDTADHVVPSNCSTSGWVVTRPVTTVPTSRQNCSLGHETSWMKFAPLDVE